MRNSEEEPIICGYQLLFWHFLVYGPIIVWRTVASHDLAVRTNTAALWTDVCAIPCSFQLAQWSWGNKERTRFRVEDMRRPWRPCILEGGTFGETLKRLRPRPKNVTGLVSLFLAIYLLGSMFLTQTFVFLRGILTRCNHDSAVMCDALVTSIDG